MQDRILNLKLLDHRFGILKLGSTQPIPEWVMKNEIYSIIRTGAELTIVCPDHSIPANVEYDKGWKCIQVEGSFDFEETGIIASLSNTLSQNGISVFVVSSYDIDYVFIKERNVEKARIVLEHKGHVFVK